MRTPAPLTTIITSTNCADERADIFTRTATSVAQYQRTTPAEWFVVRNGGEWHPDNATVMDNPAAVTVPNGAPVAHYIATARNTALGHVTTPYVTTLDDDDLLLPDSAGVREHELNSHPEYGWVAGLMCDITTNTDGTDLTHPVWEQPARPGYYYPGRLQQVWGNPTQWFPCLTHTFLLRTHLVQQLGGWWSDCPADEDIDLVIRYTNRHPGVILPTPITGYRRHAGQASREADTLKERERTHAAIWEHVKQ